MTERESIEPVQAAHQAHLQVGGPGRLDVLAAAWLAAKARRTGSARTEHTYHDTLTGFRAALATVGLDLDSDPPRVALAAEGWAGSDVAPATFNQRLAILSSFYCYARRHGLPVAENPIDRVERRPVTPYAGVATLDPADLRTRLAAIDQTALDGRRDYALLAVLLQTGRRRGEVASLRWGDVARRADGRVTLTFRRCKGGKIMQDALPAPVATSLLGYLEALYDGDLKALGADAPLWVSLAPNGTRGDALTDRSIARICAKRLGVSKVHLLRHTFARVMEDAGAKVSEIQARLGHTSLATTGRYLAALKRAENPHADELMRRFGLGPE